MTTFAEDGDRSVGFKLHLLVNDNGELVNITATTANQAKRSFCRTDDRKPLPELLKECFGRLIADKGYLSQKLTQLLSERSIELITKVRKNSKEQKLSETNAFLLRKRAIIESVIDQHRRNEVSADKNVSQVEHTRHRAGTGFLWNLATALIVYCHQTKKQSLNIIKTTALTAA